MKKENVALIISILIVIGFIASIVAYHLTVPEEKPKEPEKPSSRVNVPTMITKTYDEIVEERLLDKIEIKNDSISPFENQGLVLEINRIRHRGLLDLILKPGNAWKNEPRFYFITDIDGLVYVSKDIEAAGGAKSETLFNTWDTMFQESKAMKDAAEEQEKTKITIKIMERVKTGLFGLRTTDVEREEIHLVYDYRTGRWTGDDHFGDGDGYGHYVGDTFEVWFDIYQIDSDSDGIPFWTEVNILGTDPTVDDSTLDPDKDGIPTAWEWKWGYDPLVWDDHEHLDPDIDGIENVEEYKMAKWFADPYRPDIYIEVDGMKKSGFFDIDHVLYEESKQILIERFCQHGINVYIDNGWPDTPLNGGGEMLPHYDTLSQDSGMMLQFYKHHFPDERKGIFRYMVVAHNSGFCHPSKYNRYDTITIDSSPYRLLSRMAFTPRTQRIVLAAAAMHELGHSLGISPWTIQGCDNLSYIESWEARNKFKETWGNYRSVMNYYYIYDKNLVDYSDGSSGSPYDQNDWLEIYLPFFQFNAGVIEEAFFEPPGTDKIVNDTFNFSVEGWQYDKNLTEKFAKLNPGWSPIDPIKCEFRVYVRLDNSSTPGDRNIRVYAKPIYENTIIPSSAWTLIREGYLDEDGELLI